MSRFDASPFDELRLDLKQRMLRLWKFDTQNSTDVPSLTLAIFTEETCPRYIALSYAWGSTSVNTKLILINNGGLQITQSLWEFLLVLHMNGGYAQQWFWADQISLDQSNADERNHQVGLMGEIYSRATDVFAWSGLLEDCAHFDNDIFSASQASDLLGVASVNDYVNPHTTMLPESLTSQLRLPVIATLLSMCSHEYWDRLWIVQELRLAANVTIWCRNQSISAQSFRNYLSMLASLLHVKDMFIAGSKYAKDIEAIAPRVNAIWTKGPKIMQLLESPSSEGDRDLLSVLTTHCDGACLDPRDKIFGLQALVKTSQRVAVDYRIKVEDLVRSSARLIIRGLSTSPCIISTEKLHTPMPVRRNVFGQLSVDSLREQDETAHESDNAGTPTPPAFFSGCPSNHSQWDGALQDLRNITQAIGTPVADVESLWWSYLVPRIPSSFTSKSAFQTSPSWRQWMLGVLQECARTDKQRLLGEALHQCLLSLKQESFDGVAQELEAYRRRMADHNSQRKPSDPRLHRPNVKHGQRYNTFDWWLVPFDKVKLAFLDKINQHGFLMYGEFLAHPEEWSFSDEAPCRISDILDYPEGGDKTPNDSIRGLQEYRAGGNIVVLPV